MGGSASNGGEEQAGPGPRGGYISTVCVRCGGTGRVPARGSASEPVRFPTRDVATERSDPDRHIDRDDSIRQAVHAPQDAVREDVDEGLGPADEVESVASEEEGSQRTRKLVPEWGLTVRVPGPR